jgi:xylose isomerase
MRTYLIMKERAARWNADDEIQALVREAHHASGPYPSYAVYSAASRDALLGTSFDRRSLASRGLKYERLDQLTVEVVLGVR